MESKEQFRVLVETVAFQRKKSQEQLAVEMGYGKNYISDILSPKGKLTAKFIAAFKRKYSPSSEYTNNETAILPMGNTQVTLKDHLDLMKEKDELHKEHKQTLKEYAFVMRRIIEARLLPPQTNSDVVEGTVDYGAIDSGGNMFDRGGAPETYDDIPKVQDHLDDQGNPDQDKVNKVLKKKRK